MELNNEVKVLGVCFVMDFFNQNPSDFEKVYIGQM